MITPQVPIHRMTLRQLMTHAEKLSRDVQEFVTTDLMHKLSDLHELSRPVRRKSQYPTMAALRNAVFHVDRSMDELIKTMALVYEHLEAIQAQGQRSRSSRR